MQVLTTESPEIIIETVKPEFHLYKQAAVSHPSVTIAASLACGTALGAAVPTDMAVSAVLLSLLAVTLLLTSSAAVQRLSVWAGYPLVCGFLLAGMLMTQWKTNGSEQQKRFLQQLADSSAIRTAGSVASIPVLRTRLETFKNSSDAEKTVQTVFHYDLHGFETVDGWYPVNARLRVLVEGDVVGNICWKDRVSIVGRLETHFSVDNPGEFDYQKFLDRQQLQGLLFVRHPAGIVVSQSKHGWHPAKILSQVRHEISQVIDLHLGSNNQPLAEALLLGNRGHLQAETERQFIASGTMHLLAISGLHTGILFLFVLRLLNLLLIEHRQALVLATICCIAYALLTDLRPSVFRATVFITLSSTSQLIGRPLKMPSLIGTTVIILLLFDPYLVFDTGAWLSFLAVTALAWTESRNSSQHVSQELPPDAATWREKLTEISLHFQRRVLHRYRQMLAITLFSMPLVASQFHVVSLAGMIVNILLIPFTACTMIAGFLFLAAGLLLGPLIAGPAVLFAASLSVLRYAVDLASAFQTSYLTISDLPVWFLPVYYGLLAGMIFTPSIRVQNRMIAMQLTCLLVAFSAACSRTAETNLTCTVLSVGHGNAVVMTTPDSRVLVFDAGSLHRGHRASDTLARYLWHRGHRMIDAVVLSHADADHYNSILPLLDLVPIGQIITTSDFVRSDAPGVKDLLQAFEHHEIPVTLVQSGDRAWVDEVTIEFQQADIGVSDNLLNSHQPALNDNELSLLATVNYRGRSIALPGDLDGRGFELLAAKIQPVDVLICPHHGSLNSNSRATRQAYQPETLIVSSRTDNHRAQLSALFDPLEHYLATAVDGAITVRISSNAAMSVTSFHQTKTAPSILSRTASW